MLKLSYFFKKIFPDFLKHGHSGFKVLSDNSNFCAIFGLCIGCLFLCELLRFSWFLICQVILDCILNTLMLWYYVFFESYGECKKKFFFSFFEGWEDFLSRPLTLLGSGHVSIYVLCTKIPMSDFHSLCWAVPIVFCVCATQWLIWEHNTQYV